MNNRVKRETVSQVFAEIDGYIGAQMNICVLIVKYR